MNGKKITSYCFTRDDSGELAACCLYARLMERRRERALLDSPRVLNRDWPFSLNQKKPVKMMTKSRWPWANRLENALSAQTADLISANADAAASERWITQNAARLKQKAAAARCHRRFPIKDASGRHNMSQRYGRQ
ncbi:hypothetical protein [Vibrio cortegadensis]|uniref:hypothetical protein n=1 Tax=Vibrio cortegadensis TaxID=1328770 RepID=UPI0021C2F313|nr:hypothetical protein [Vibrio cortegadensis]